MNSKKQHLWKGEYRSFVDIAKLESVSYDVLKKSFYQLNNMEKALDYAKNAVCIKDNIKYEYKGLMYNQKDYCELIAKDTGLTFGAVKSRVKQKWSLDDIISTPKYKLPEKTRKEYGKKMGAQVKIYDLDDNLLFESNTYREAAEFLGTTQSNVVNTCMRFGVFGNKYKIRSKSSSLEKKELLNKQVKANNDNWCRIEYPTPELNALASKRGREITYDLYYKNNKDQIIEKVKEYYYKNSDVKSDYNKIYSKTNREHLIEKNKEWRTKNKDRHTAYFKNYRRNASDTLNDIYIKTTLGVTLGLSFSQITPEMIDIKRKQVKLYRELK